MHTGKWFKEYTREDELPTPDEYVFMDNCNMISDPTDYSKIDGSPNKREQLQKMKDSKFMGTPYFCSLLMAKTNKYSRRDDIESIIYCLAYLIKGKLPWDQDYYLIEEEKCSPRNADGNDCDKILERKKNINEHDVCDRLPIDLKHLFKYTIRIDIDEEPDYDFILNTLTYL